MTSTAPLTARRITAAFRATMVPAARLRTSPEPRSADFTVTMAKAAALHLHLVHAPGRAFVSGVLTRQLGQPVHIPAVPRLRGQSAFVTVRPGPAPAERCATVGHAGRPATHLIRYTYQGKGPEETELVCAECAESYSRRPVLTGFTATPIGYGSRP